MAAKNNRHFLSVEEQVAELTMRKEQPSRGLGGRHTMDTQAAIIRLKEFELEGHRRRIAQLQIMIADFERLSADLDRDIQVEEDRSGIHDPANYAYPTLAKAALQRRDNLRRSIAGLRSQLDAARKSVAEAIEKIGTFATLDDRQAGRGPLAMERGRSRRDHGLDRAS
jgi:hypothetical protein